MVVVVVVAGCVVGGAILAGSVFLQMEGRVVLCSIKDWHRVHAPGVAVAVLHIMHRCVALCTWVCPWVLACGVCCVARVLRVRCAVGV